MTLQMLYAIINENFPNADIQTDGSVEGQIVIYTGLKMPLQLDKETMAKDLEEIEP